MAVVGPDMFLRIGGVSGALAVVLGAYAGHAFQGDLGKKTVFEVGNKYHLLHSVALLAVPLTQKPMLVGSLMTTGMILFSGGLYLSARFQMRFGSSMAPIGATILVAAWFCAAL